MSHPPKAGHTRVTIDLAPGQTVAQALGLGAASDGKAEAYVRDLAAAVRELDLPKLPKEGPRWLEWLRDVATHSRVEVDEEGRSSLRKPEGGAEFWRTGLREAALELTGAHLNVVTPKGFVQEVHDRGRVAGEASLARRMGFAAEVETGRGAAISNPDDPYAFVAFLTKWGEGLQTKTNDVSEAEAYERGRVAGLRDAVWLEGGGSRWIVRAPGSLVLDDSAERPWEKKSLTRTYGSRERAQAAADTAPNWWEAGQ